MLCTLFLQTQHHEILSSMDYFGVGVPAVVDASYVRHNLLVLKFSDTICSLKPEKSPHIMDVDAEVALKSPEPQDLQIRISNDTLQPLA